MSVLVIVTKRVSVSPVQTQLALKAPLILFCCVGPGCVLCTRIDPLRFLAGCRRRRLNQRLVVALGFSRC